MLAKCFSAALPALSREALEIDPRKTALTARDFQLYCYYGGMIFTGGASSHRRWCSVPQTSQAAGRSLAAGAIVNRGSTSCCLKTKLVVPGHSSVNVPSGTTCSTVHLRALQVNTTGLYMGCILCASVAAMAGVRRYADALELFLYGLTAPTMVLNAITMCSYKKYILVSLVHTGAPPHRYYECWAYMQGVVDCLHMSIRIQCTTWGSCSLRVG